MKNLVTEKLQELGYNTSAVNKAKDVAKWLYLIQFDEAREILAIIAEAMGCDEVVLK